MAKQKTQLVCYQVQVLCPHCSEAQPNVQGDDFWTREDFEDAPGQVECVSCEAEILIFSENKVMFE